MKKLISEEISKDSKITSQQYSSNSDSPQNNQYIFDAFMKGSYKYLKSSDAKSALLCLIKSERVYEDLTSIHPFLKKEKISSSLDGDSPSYDGPSIGTSIVIREWNEHVVEHPEMEFRGFVYKNNFTALSQYDYMSYHPKIANNPNQISQKIQTFWNTHLKQILTSHESYIIDLFVCEDGQIKVVELNSFEAWTGGCLFTWAEDKEILMCTEEGRPLEFRYVKAPPQQDLLLMLGPNWKGFVEDCIKNTTKHN